jgi:peptidoglycan/xylan/chitin deacetylase (PgdA/CDA1 family)
MVHRNTIRFTNEMMSAPAPLFSHPDLGRALMKWGATYILLSFLNSFACRAGTVSPPYQIGTWQGFRQAAITYTFDDDLPNQYSMAVPMFNAYGFKMTLFTVTSWLPGASWSPVQTAATYGHEIASHTVTHPDLSTSAAVVVTNELKNSQSSINANVPSQKCVTIAYPYCTRPASAVSDYYIAARGCSGQLVPATPPDFLNISSFVCGSQGLLQFADMKAKADAAAAARSWCVYLIHAVENDNGYSPLPSVTLQATLNYLSTNQSKFWVETFGHVVCYIRERNAASVTETSNANDSITIQVTDNLDDSVYNYPITLRRPLPASWPGAAVSQSSTPLPAQFINVNSTNFVTFDVVPDGGDVILSKRVVPVVMSNPVLTTPTTFSFRLDGQAGARYVTYGSGDLANWAPLLTNVLASASTNCIVAASGALRFYRVQWMP